ncbi:MAG: PQQ-binding-like beta-propeller repeat protein [Acidobacteria bacterium]|nr:PQQ-binding-like beta-propeller repeat protein [Acidobacteriota bacterium]
MDRTGNAASRRRALIWLAGAPAALHAAWPEFRGPSGQGLAPVGELPLEWDETRNVAWKTEIPGRGWSSPVILDGRTIWLTTATEDGKSLRAVAVDFASGRVEKDIEVFRDDQLPSSHKKNSQASPTPILEPNRIYLHFGVRGTAALDATGKVLWKNEEHVFNPVHGAGGSPALWQDLLIFTCDGGDKQYVAAVDKNTGKTRWTTSRGKSRMSFATPLMIEVGGKPQVICPGGDLAAAYDPATGEEIWRVTYDGFSVVPRPVYAHGLVFIVTGFYTPAVTAIRPDGRGDVTGSHVVWRETRGAPLTPSPIVVGDDLFMVSDNGIASCLEAKTGRRWWQARLGGNASASPIVVGERIYFSSEAGETTVIAAEREFRELAKNKLDSAILASPAVEGAALLMRTENHLYRIETLQ